MPKILVIGSSNTDMVIKSSKLPSPGETILGGNFLMNPGGKGANQAVAAAKLGGSVTFIAKVGTDIFGANAIEGFRSHGINTNHIIKSAEAPSGVALIMVDAKGENSISVALGANAILSEVDLDQIEMVFKEADYLLIQLETPVYTVQHAIRLAKKHNTKVILNPAPAQNLPDTLFRDLDIITPNESETALLTGHEIKDESDVRHAAQLLKDKGVGTVIITLGSKGAYVYSDEEDEIVPCPQVTAVDTTAAGDTFNGALVVGLSEGMKMREAVAFANQAAALSVTKMGAQASCPARADL